MAGARHAALLGLALLGGGCANDATFASAADASAYRATRVAPTLDARLAAAHRYLKERPDGAFQGAVRAWFDHAEEVYYAAKQQSRAGLYTYLDTLPNGPHSADAESRLKAFDLAARSRRAELERSAAFAEARASGPGAAARARVRGELDGWLQRFLDPEAYRLPLAKAQASLVVPWSLSLPSPRCTLFEPPEGSITRRCTKLLELAYEVEGPNGADPREATLEITLLEGAAHTPIEVDLAGPDLFLRLEETYRVIPLAPDDAAQRAAARARAVTFVRRAFAEALHLGGDPQTPAAGAPSTASCEQPVQPPIALRLACGGVLAEVIPAAAPGDDDRIVLTPLPSPAAPAAPAPAAPSPPPAPAHPPPRGR